MRSADFRFFLAAIAPALLLAASPAFAESKLHTPTGLTATQFVANCNSMGGTSSSSGSGNVNCGLRSGTNVECTYDTSGNVTHCVSSRQLPQRSFTALFGAGGAAATTGTLSGN
jgi:hypothetical protein